MFRAASTCASLFAAFYVFGGDGDLDVSALFELYVIPMLVDECICNSKIAIPSFLGCVEGNLCLFRLISSRRGEDLFDSSGHAGAWRLRYSPRSQIQFCNSYRPGHARLGHFLLDAGTRRDFEFGLFSSLQDRPIMPPRWQPFSSISHSRSGMRVAWLVALIPHSVRAATLFL